MSDRIGKFISALNATPNECRLDELEISVRARNALQNLGLATIGDIKNLSGNPAWDLLRLPNFGYKSLDELTDCFKGYVLDNRHNPDVRLEIMIRRVVREELTKAFFKIAL